MPKYSRYIFGGRNAQFSIGTRQEKGRVECLWEFQIFYQGIIAQILGKNICYLKSPISSWTGPQSKLLFWAFAKNPTTQWISFGVILVILVMGVILGHESIVERLAFFLLGLTHTSRIDRWAILFDPLGSCCTRLFKNEMSQDDAKLVGWLFWLAKHTFFATRVLF